MTLIQGAGVDWPGPRIVTYSLPSRRNPPSPLKNSSSGGGAPRGRASLGAPGARVRTADRLAWVPRRDRADPARLPCCADQHDPRAETSAAPRLGGDQVGAQHEDPARRPLDARIGPRLAGAHQRLERDLQVLHVGGRRSFRMTRSTASCFIRQYSCACSSWRATPRFRCRRSAAARSAGRRRCPATTARMRPEPADGVRRGAQRAGPRRDMAREALKQAGLARLDAEMMQLHLRLGPGERRRALDRPPRRDACRRGRAAPRDSRRHVQNATRPCPGPRDATAQREDRIEHGSDRIGQGPPSSIAIGALTPCPRPRKRARRSRTPACRRLRHWRRSDARPRFPAPGRRFRRVARIAPRSARYSVSTNSFAKAGCATSALCGPRRVRRRT
jgi:hypothetical protein